MPAERLLPTIEAEDLLKLAREIAKDELAPIASRYEEDERFPREQFTLLGRSGLLGLPYPEQWGGGAVPYEVPLGASTPLGAAAFALAVAELMAPRPGEPPPAVSVHASSSGGTQAGLAAGGALLDLPTRVLGISADDPAASIADSVHRLVGGIGTLAGHAGDLAARAHVEVDDSFVGEGYGIPSPASHEAQSLAARTEALFVDHTYTAKALAALVAYVRDGRFTSDDTVLFWHTGGQTGLFV